jgi:hypothetical protein
MKPCNTETASIASLGRIARISATRFSQYGVKRAQDSAQGDVVTIAGPRRMTASRRGEAQYKKRCWSILQQRFSFGGARYRAYCLLVPRPYILP